MPGFLLDSNFCIACIRRKPWAIQALSSVPLNTVAVSSMTLCELALGAHLAAKPEVERANVESFLRPIPVLAFGRDEASHWAELDASLRKQGNRIETEDAIIAATAQAHAMVLVTGNAKHFARIKGLKIVDWEKEPPTALPRA
jgi:tRNA(fMet)-specific endonuclease VapC